MGGWSLEPETQDDLDARIESVQEWSRDARGAGTWHFPVIQLDVASEWAVAGATFRPKGWLAKHVTELGASEHLREALARLDCATVDMYAESQDAARARARDAVGLLRYYQRYLRVYTTAQGSRFGLTDEVFVNDDMSVREKDGRVISHSVGIVGRYGHFEFGAGHIDYFNYAPGLTVLSEALAETAGTDWQQRFRSCLRFLGLAALIDEQQLRIVLIAAGLEVLLADGSMARPLVGVPKGTTADEVARRCAFLACGTKGAPEDRPGYPECDPDFCPALTIADRNKRTTAAKRRGAQDRYAQCEAFVYAQRLFDDRNSVLHQGRDDFQRTDATQHAVFADRVVLSAARWVQGSGAKTLRGLVRLMPSTNQAVRTSIQSRD
jgi:hypothetical protein